MALQMRHIGFILGGVIAFLRPADPSVWINGDAFVDKAVFMSLGFFLGLLAERLAGPRYDSSMEVNPYESPKHCEHSRTSDLYRRMSDALGRHWILTSILACICCQAGLVLLRSLIQATNHYLLNSFSR